MYRLCAGDFNPFTQFCTGKIFGVWFLADDICISIRISPVIETENGRRRDR
jgi:hypothetical protein